jgi:magnesium transporter
MNVMEKPWEKLHDLIADAGTQKLLSFFDALGAAETARTISRISQEDQIRLFTLLAPEDAAELIEDISDVQAADLIEDLPPEMAAAILEELDSDHIVDVLGEIDDHRVEKILDEMDYEDAREARQFLEYPKDSAGGIMVSEFLAYAWDKRVSDILKDLQKNRETYAEYNVQYLYVVRDRNRLAGVLRMRDLLFSSHDAFLRDLMIKDPLKVEVDKPLEQLRGFFEEHKLFGVPVIDSQGQMLGVVLPEDVKEASRERSVRQFLGFSGIIGGEEFRSMPLLVRSGRRLSWLSLNIILNIIAASVIAMYQDTLSAVIALAVFLPMVSDMSGCSGNQAVAISMRELSLGLIRTNELMRVLAKEASLGIINGAALGLLLGGVAYLWMGNLYLGVVVGGGLAVNTIVAVTLGGMLPLLLKRLKMDPALVSSPLLTTVTDMCGFFFVLSFATAMMDKISGV